MPTLHLHVGNKGLSPSPEGLKYVEKEKSIYFVLIKGGLIECMFPGYEGILPTQIVFASKQSNGKGVVRKKLASEAG